MRGLRESEVEGLTPLVSDYQWFLQQNPKDCPYANEQCWFLGQSHHLADTLCWCPENKCTGMPQAHTPAGRTGRVLCASPRPDRYSTENHTPSDHHQSYAV